MTTVNRFYVSVLALIMFASCATINDTAYKQKFEAMKAESAPAFAASGVTLTSRPESVARSAPEAVTTASNVTSSAKPAATVMATASPAAVKKKKTARPLNIESDSMTFNREANMAVFKGNVVVTSTGIKVVSDILRSKDYRNGAEAEGNVRAQYKDNGVDMTCKRINYTEKMRFVKATGNVVAKKVTADGNTMTIQCDEVDFDTQENLIKAKKVKHRSRIEYKDITAFCDELTYDEVKGELVLTGNPLFKKKRSVFLSDTVKLDVNRKVITLEGDIWSKVSYTEYTSSKKEFSETQKTAR